MGCLPEDGVLEIRDIDDVSGGVTVSSRTSAFLLIELIVEQQVAVVIGGSPSLVSVGGTIVSGTGQLARHSAARDVDNGQRILVVVEADLMAPVCVHWTLVDDALSIMDIAVIGNAASILRAVGSRYVNHPQAATAGQRGISAHGEHCVGVFIGNDVVAAAEAAKARRYVGRTESRGVGRVCRKQLAKIKDLQAMVRGLRANVGVVLDNLDVAPRRGNSVCGQTTDVAEATVVVNLDEGGTVRLTDESELTAVGSGPTCTSEVSHRGLGKIKK